MLATAVLLGLVLALLFVLELLNAFYRAMLDGQLVAAQSEPRRVSLWRLPIVVVRRLILWLMTVLQTVSLWIHELSHALAQLLSGGMPRVVMCRGGGYAQPRDWPIGYAGRLIHFYGRAWGNVLSPMAPLLVGSTLLAAAIWFLTPLRGSGTVGAWMHALATTASTPEAMRALPATGLAVVRGLGAALFGGGVVAMAVVFALATAVASCLTPSSTDFANARWALPGFIVGVAASAWVLETLPTSVAALVGVGAGVGALVTYRVTARQERRWYQLFGAFAATVLPIAVAAKLGALGGQPAMGVARGVAGLVLLLSVAALLYVGFMALMVALTVLSLRFAPLWEGLKAAPREIRSVFTEIAICQDKRIMFQDRCDFCQCTLREFKRNGCGGQGLDKPRKTGIRGLLSRLTG